MIKKAGKAFSETVRLLLGWCLVWVFVSIMVRMLTPDPATQLAGPIHDEATRQLFAQEFGLDRPLLLESVDRALRMLRGEWGVSWRTRAKVRDVVLQPATLSILLAFISAIISLLVALLIVTQRCLSKVARGNKHQLDLSIFYLFLAAIPSFIIGLWLAGSSLPDFLGLPRIGFRSTGLPLWRPLVLPVFCLSLTGVGIVLPRLLAAGGQVISSDWFKATLSTGCQRRHAFFYQGWPIMLAALGDGFAQVFVVSFTGAVAVEHVFALPGLGTLMFDAVQVGDVPILMGVVAITTFLTFAALGVRTMCAWALPSPLRPVSVLTGKSTR